MDLREYLVGLGLSPTTIYHYMGAVKSAGAWCEARGLDLDSVGPLDIATYAETKPMTFASRNLLRAALTHYWAAQGRERPPVRAIRVPPKPEMVCRALEPADAGNLAVRAGRASGPAALAVLAALYLALRRAEIAAMRWDAFHDGWYRVVGKGDKAATLPVHPILLEVLERTEHRGEWVFPGRMVGHVSPATVWEWVREFTEAAGLGEVPCHVLRHTTLATANDVTGDLRAVSRFARHSKVQTTMGYTRTTSRKLTEVMMSLDYGAALTSSRPCAAGPSRETCI